MIAFITMVIIELINTCAVALNNLLCVSSRLLSQGKIRQQSMSKPPKSRVYVKTTTSVPIKSADKSKKHHTASPISTGARNHIFPHSCSSSLSHSIMICSLIPLIVYTPTHYHTYAHRMSHQHDKEPADSCRSESC